jgi:hypothetical protein
MYMPAAPPDETLHLLHPPCSNAPPLLLPAVTTPLPFLSPPPTCHRMSRAMGRSAFCRCSSAYRPMQASPLTNTSITWLAGDRGAGASAAWNTSTPVGVGIRGGSSTGAWSREAAGTVTKGVNRECCTWKKGAGVSGDDQHIPAPRLCVSPWQVAGLRRGRGGVQTWGTADGVLLAPLQQG